MTTADLTPDEFLTHLTNLLTTAHDPSTSKSSHSIFLTQKPLPSAPTTQVLLRATNGLGKTARAAKIKLRTVVEVDDVPEFYQKYSEVCKKGMEALRKRERRKAKARGKNKSKKTKKAAAK